MHPRMATTASPRIRAAAPDPADRPVAELLAGALQIALDAEAAEACAAAPFQRRGGPAVHRNGATRRALPTPFGTAELRVPRLSAAGFRTAAALPARRGGDALAAPALRLAAGINTWGAIEELLAPLRRAHGDAAWIARAARRILVLAESRRRPPPPLRAALLRIEPMPALPATDALRALRVRMDPADGGAAVVWHAAAPDPAGWQALAAALHAGGLLAIDRAVVPPSAGGAEAIRGRWPACAVSTPT